MLLCCEWARRVWFGCNVNIRIRLESVSNFGRWCEDYLVNNVAIDDVDRCYFGFTCWFIWKERCSVALEGCILNPIGVCEKINHGVGEFIAANGVMGRVNRGSTEMGGSLCKWEPPREGLLKVNTDGAFRAASGKGGVGVVIRNEMGEVVDGFGDLCFVDSAIMAEAFALRKGVAMISAMSCDNVVIEFDCEVLVSAVQHGLCDVDWRCSAVLEDVLALARSVEGLTFKFVKRSANLAADWVAKMSSEEMCPRDWVCSPPSSLLSILRKDVGLLDEATGVG